MAYDFTVLAGTQGHQNHRKTDRMIQIANDFRLPLVLYAEGGGGRPGDTDGGFSSRTFYDFPRLSGLVPMIGITSGRCYAGNASLLGICDVVIATKGSNIGMGGPAMIEGGGLGIFRPEEIGPLDVQTRSGVIDVAVEDEAEATRVAKKYLSYFQGSLDKWSCPDQRLLRGIIPENRLRVYDIRSVVHTMADTDSVLELRPHFGHGMITAFIRIEGHPFGLIANNPNHLAGAIDSDGSDKAAHFVQLVRRVRRAADFSVRHARHHGRSRDREDRAGASFVATVCHCGECHGPLLHDCIAQSLWPRRNRDGGRRV